nr:putative leucine-rich repeat-containing protein DD [Biomphalaria glabrata]
MDETDADGEWSDEEVLQSGSQTGLSETEQEDGQLAAVIQIQRPRPPFSGIVKNGQLTMTSSYPLSVPPSTDPVSVMMDKIDAELLAIEKEETMASRPRKLNDNVRPNEIGQKYANSGTPEVEFSDPRTSGARAIKESSNSDILSFKKSLTTEGKDLNDSKIVSDVPKDLDPITASEIDAKFKEIMSKKKDQNPESVLETSRLSGRPPRHSLTNNSHRVTIQESLVPQSAHDQGRQLENLIARLRLKNASRPSATMLSSGGYATDNESVKTEDFESKFFSLMVNPTEADRQQTLVKRIEEEQSQHPTTDGAPHSILKVQLSRPRSCSPVRMR